MKTMLCVAALLCGAPLSHAQDSSLTIYGNLIGYLEGIGTFGATAGVPANRPNLVPISAFTGVNEPYESELNSSTSHVGLRGIHNIAGDLSVWFQIESSVPIDTGGRILAGRNTGLALQGFAGTVIVGQWDTPHKYVSLFGGMLRGLFPWDAAFMNNPGLGVPITTTQGGRANSPADASFNRRQGNSMQYWTPLVDGLSARVMYGVPENKISATATSPALASALYSGSLSYSSGGLQLYGSYEQHRDYFGLSQIGGSPGATSNNPGLKDEGYQALAIYYLDDWKFVGQLERLRYAMNDTLQGAVNRYRRDAVWVSVSKRFGTIQAWISTGSTCRRVGGSACSADGLGGKEFVLGWSYDLSQRTQLFAAAYLTRNEESQVYAGDIFPVAPGADTRGAAIGMMRRF